MKKNYMKPSMVAVKIEEQILAGSLGKYDETVQEGLTKRGAFDEFEYENEE